LGKTEVNSRNIRWRMNMKNHKNNDGNEIKNISVVWENGNVKGFNSFEAALLYIERVCKKTAPEMEYSVM